MQNQSHGEITFDTQLKTALMKNLSVDIPVCAALEQKFWNEHSNRRTREARKNQRFPSALPTFATNFKNKN